MCTGQVALSKTIVGFLGRLDFYVALAAIWINHAKMTEANDALNSGGMMSYVACGYMQVFYIYFCAGPLFTQWFF